MSVVALSDLPHHRSPDDAAPIGSKPKGDAVTAREIVRASRRELRFGPERPIWLAPTWRVVRVRDRHRQIWRFEVKSDPRDSCAPRAGQTLIVTEHPYGNGWVELSTFKPGIRRSADERLPPPARSLEEALASVRQLPYDPWESGRMVTATPDVPEPVLQGETLRSYDKGAAWVFGVCDQGEQLVEELRMSPRAKELVGSAERGGIRLVRPSPTDAPFVNRLPNELREQASEVMLLAARQALAGPTDAKVDSWTGRPVLDLVEQIFRDHLSNRARILFRAQRRQRTRPA